MCWRWNLRGILCGIVQRHERLGVCVEESYKRVAFEEFLHIVEGLHSRLENEDFEPKAVVACHLSFRRNSLNYGGLFTHPSQLVKNAPESRNEFKSANAKTHGRRENDNSLISSKVGATYDGFL